MCECFLVHSRAFGSQLAFVVHLAVDQRLRPDRLLLHEHIVAPSTEAHMIWVRANEQTAQYAACSSMRKGCNKLGNSWNYQIRRTGSENFTPQRKQKRS